MNPSCIPSACRVRQIGVFFAVLAEKKNRKGKGKEKRANFRTFFLNYSLDLHSRTVQSLVREFNVVFKEGVIPTTWQQYRMLLHYKGHDAHPGCCDNYRGLGIGDGSLKIMSMVLEERLSTFLVATKALSSEQMGFKRQSGTIEATLTLSEIIKNATKTKPVLVAFIDVQAAYDSVIREVLYAKMLRMGIGGKFLTTVQGFYNAMVAELEVGKFGIGPVVMEVGLAQGSPLSPLLFNVYLDECVRGLKVCAHEKSQQEGGVPYGLPLPSAPGELQTNTTVSQWFADDGALMEYDILMAACYRLL